MIVDCVSDLHGFYPNLEGGDLLIVAGDLTAADTLEEIDEFSSWLEQQRYKKKIFISGNHDNLLVKENPKKYMLRYGGISTEKFEYLCDSGTEFEGLKIWGSPWTASFKGINPKCTAFTIPFGVDTDEHLADKWALIPENIDILVTHSPSYGIFDGISNEDGSDFHVGSMTLRNLILSTVRMPNLKLHVFGHIHEQGGKQLNLNSLILVNASHVNERYKPVNKPVRVIL